MSFKTRLHQLPSQRVAAGGDPADARGPDQAADGAKAQDRPAVRPPAAGRRVVSAVVTAVAAVLVLLALVTPDQVSRLAPGSFVPGAFVRIPVEGLLTAVLLMVLPPRPRRLVAGLLGFVLGLLSIIKLIDMGFFAELARPFDPVLDWVLFDDGYSFLIDSIGRAGAIGTVAAAALLAVGLLVLMTLAVPRLARVLVGHRRISAAAVGALTAAWLVCSPLAVQIVPGVPVAADTAAALAHDKALLVPAALHDRRAFAAEAAVDSFRDTPPQQLLTGLRGKDVIVTFIESYGRNAVQDPELAPQVGAVLDDGTRRLKAAGFAARSGFLTSPTAGGGSWLAHSTFLSGLWIDNQQRYRSLVSSQRQTLIGAFRRASWPTVAVEPGLTYAWPEAQFYGYDRVYDAHTLGYAGPKFSWATMPDQYTLSAFQRLEYAKANRGPLMAEMTFVSSHTPWAPIPDFIDWKDVGDGSVYAAMARGGKSPDTVWRDPAQVRAEYRRSIEYSLTSLISYVEKYGDKNLVLVFLGDHQPAPIVVGEGASHDVPVTIVAHDPAVLDRVADWGWQDGLRPDPHAPVWRMDEFRDRFLTAFGSTPTAARPLVTPAR